MKGHIRATYYCRIIFFIVACAWPTVHSADVGSRMIRVFGMEDTDFVASIQAVKSSANRWKPGEEPLPIDIADCARKAKLNLLSRRSELPATHPLLSAEIVPFTPDLPGEPQKVYWYLVFTFSNTLPSGGRLDWRDCTVGMMMDGTILKTARNTPKAPR